MQPYRARSLAALVLLVAAAACSDTSTKDSPVGAEKRQRPPTYVIQEGKVRLNLQTPEARARVVYRDPVQGVKDANGKCTFPNLGRIRPGKDLSALVGEWDTETCAGLLYYFRAQPTDRHPKPAYEDTAAPPTTPNSPTGAQAMTYDPCATIAFSVVGLPFGGSADTIIAVWRLPTLTS